METKTFTVGSIVLTTDQGLGYLAKSFFDNGIIDKVLIRHHSSRTNHYDWYPESARVNSIEELVKECDTLLFFEEVWYWDIIPLARSKNVLTVLMPMYECTRSPLPHQPDWIIAPSLLDEDYYPGSTFLPVPVSVPWRQRTKARVFAHNAGNGGLGGRNGTKELLEAIQYVKSPIKLVVRSQVDIPSAKINRDDRIEFRIGQFDDLWKDEDVFIFPEKFNGLSLPLQEAYASGMAVMAGDRYPINTWLPRWPLIPVFEYRTETISREFKSAVYDPEQIARTIDAWYDKDITDLSLQGKEWAEQHSWKQLKEKYLALLSPS